MVFLPDPDDQAERAAIADAGGEEIPCAGGYARKINHGVRHTTEPLIFFAADDLIFHPGWLEAAVRHMDRDIQVVGVNDLIPRRPSREGHATHFLVTRAYAELPCIDSSLGPLHAGYLHNYVDDEFIGTAERRGAYRYALDAHVEHDHPMVGAADDDTYRKGRATWRHDQALHKRRRRMWIW